MNSPLRPLLVIVQNHIRGFDSTHPFTHSLTLPLTFPLCTISGVKHIQRVFSECFFSSSFCVIDRWYSIDRKQDLWVRNAAHVQAEKVEVIRTPLEIVTWEGFGFNPEMVFLRHEW